MKQTLKVGTNNIGYLSAKFKEIFGDIKVSLKKVKLQSRTLEKPMNDSQILKEWRPKEVSLDEFVYALENKEGLLTNGYANIFYVRDSKDTLGAVLAYWVSINREWFVFAHLVSDPNVWDSGHRVVSQEFSALEPSETGDLENRIKILEDFKSRVEKVLKI